MTSQETRTQNDPATDLESGIPIRAIILFILFAVLLPMVMFLSAGTFNWTMAWVYLTIHVVFTLGGRFIAWRRNPGVLRERARFLEVEDAKPWDKIVVLIGGVLGPLVLFLVAGFDYRYNASPELPQAVMLIALAFVFFGFIWGTWAFVTNAYFSAVVRIQEDRGQTVIQNGPYRIMRHPGYAGGLLAYLAIPIMLGTLWSLLPAVLLILVMVYRTSMEDKTLQEELPGYVEYAARTRFRLIPGIW